MLRNHFKTFLDIVTTWQCDCPSYFIDICSPPFYRKSMKVKKSFIKMIKSGVSNCKFFLTMAFFHVRLIPGFPHQSVRTEDSRLIYCLMQFSCLRIWYFWRKIHTVGLTILARYHILSLLYLICLLLWWISWRKGTPTYSDVCTNKSSVETLQIHNISRQRHSPLVCGAHLVAEADTSSGSSSPRSLPPVRSWCGDMRAAEVHQPEPVTWTHI